MKTTTPLNELAKEMIQFKSMDENASFSDHIRMYETLSRKIEQAGISYYDLDLYVRHVTVK